MKRRTWHSFVKSHNLVNRIYDMLDYFHCFDKAKDVGNIRKELKNKLQDIYYVETLAKYFEDKKNLKKRSVELNYNLKDIINDLNYLKQYLEK